MLRKVLAICAALLLALGACGDDSTVAGGMLSRDEIEHMESLYLSDRETALKGLGFSEKDVDSDSEDSGFFTGAGAYPLKKERSIGGIPYRQIILTSVAKPEGLYGIRFQAVFTELEDAEKAREALIEVASELYGEPVYPGTERWTVGKATELSLHQISGPGDGKGPYNLTVDYCVPAVVDGRRLLGDELTKMVRDAQGK